MLVPLLIMVVAWKFFYISNLLVRTRTRLIEQDQRKRWVHHVLTGADR
jgi:hypothetical protein